MRLRRVHGGSGTAFSAVAVALIGALSLVLPASGEAQGSSSFVTRSGTQLRLDGQAYRFTGINIYNANNASGCWYPLGSGSELGDSLDAIGGGAKVIRAWFFQALATNDAGARDWNGIDHTLSVAAAHGVRVIVTLGNQWIDCDGPGGGAGSYKDEAWYTNGYKQPDPAGTESYRDWVAEIVARYKNNPTILAWQLMNEAEVKPYGGSGSCSVNAEQTLKAFATDVSGLVKSIDSNHLVSLGTIGGGQCGAQGDEYQDLHDIPTVDLCEYHDYGSPTAPMPGDQFNGLQRRLTQCNALGKPLFVGETGIRPNDVPSNVQPNFPLYDRANAFEAKFRAQFAAGVAGELVWAWDKDGSKEDDYDIGPGDQTLRTLTVWNSPSPGTIERASVSATGTQGDARSTVPYITPDGRYVLFSSEANNLTPADTQGASGCGRLDVFVKDRQTGTVDLVSVDSAEQPLGGPCGNFGFGISANGDRVLFQSDAYRSPSGSSVGSDILVRDRAAGTTRNLTAGANDGRNSNGFLTSNGRYAVFTSNATNLAPGASACSHLRMYLYDLTTSVVSLVSPDEPNDQCRTNGANLAAVSEDGRYVAFQTDADLVPEDVSQFRDLDVYLLDRATGAVTLVSRDSTGTGAVAFDPSISGDGNFIAYVSDNANIVPGDTNSPGGAQRGWDVFVWDRVRDTTERVSVDSSGHELESSFRPHLSARGRFVAFTSGHSPVGSHDPSGYFDVFVRDREAGTTERILGQAGVPGGGFTDVPRLSPTGRFVVFPSSGTTYVAGDTNNAEDVFVHERSGPVEQPLGGSDGNGDGIADSLQPAGTPAGSFSNSVQGKANPTIGTVVSGSVTVEDVADPTKGVRITATSDAVLTVCGGFELDLAAGGAATITCSSVSVENITGAPATVKAGGASVVFPTGTAGTVGTVGGLTVTGVSGSGVTLTVGGVQAPVPTGDSRLIQGNGGNTVLNGSAGNDLILDAGGNNTIDGKGGDDTIIVNGNGNNTIKGGTGTDTITTGSGNDAIDGGDGNDTINAGNGNNAIKGGTGTDTITTGSGNDAIDGGDGNDSINAGNGNNTITGGTGNDSLRAGTGNDMIDGGTGTDLCTPGSGKNTVKNCEGALT